MLTHDRPLGRWARARRVPRYHLAALASRPEGRRLAAQRLTTTMALLSGAGLGLPLLLTWVQLNRPAGVALPWKLYVLSWVWAGLFALLAFVVAVWTAPLRLAPASSLTGGAARRLHPRPAPRERGLRDVRPRSRRPRGPRVVAVVATVVAVALVVLSLVLP